MVTCQYAGHDEDGNPAYCDREAQVVVRRRDPLNSASGHMDAQKTPVCARHAEYVTSDEVPIEWERCGSLETGKSWEERQAEG